MICTPSTIMERQAQLEAVHAEVFGNREDEHKGPLPANEVDPVIVDMHDQELIQKAMSAANGENFQRIWYGDRSSYPTHSEADMALCDHLAFWCGPDPVRIDRLFRRSELYRDKWDQRHSADGRTYGEMTISKALARGQFYTSTGDHRPDPLGGSFNTNGANPEIASRRFHLTDVGNAKRLVRRHGNYFRYCYLWGKVLVWDGMRWKPDDTGEVYRKAKDTVASIYTEASSLAAEASNEEDEAHRAKKAEIAEALLKWAKQTEARTKIEAMVALAESEPGIPVTPDQLDTNPWLLNVLNGTINLWTGQLRDHRREDLITNLAPVEYDPIATCPTWEAFLCQIMAGNKNLIDFLQRAVGYALTGDVSEQVIFFLYGIGANGKSTLLNIFMSLLGDYAMKATSDLLMVKKGEAHPTERADLFGRRFVAAIETEQGKRLAETFVKEATGGDPIRARRMREDFWQFDPTHKIFLATNHKPEIRGTDYAIWRRIRLIPFDVTIPDEEQDKKLSEKLRAEAPGILGWAVRGCLAWQRDGLGIPEEVKEATLNYRNEMDILANFLNDCCVIEPSAQAGATPLFKTYQKWCGRKDEDAITQKKFGTWLGDKGFSRTTMDGRKFWRGVGLLEDVGVDEEHYGGG